MASFLVEFTAVDFEALARHMPPSVLYADRVSDDAWFEARRRAVFDALAAGGGREAASGLEWLALEISNSHSRFCTRMQHELGDGWRRVYDGLRGLGRDTFLEHALPALVQAEPALRAPGRPSRDEDLGFRGLYIEPRRVPGALARPGASRAGPGQIRSVFHRVDERH